MKKDSSSEIQKLAREYAKSGKYSHWLSIEHAISAEGYIGAKTALDCVLPASLRGINFQSCYHQL